MSMPQTSTKTVLNRTGWRRAILATGLGLWGIAGTHSALANPETAPPLPASLFLSAETAHRLRAAWQQGQRSPMRPEAPSLAVAVAAPEQLPVTASPVIVHGLLEIDDAWVAWTTERKIDSLAESKDTAPYSLHQDASGAPQLGVKTLRQPVIAVAVGQRLEPEQTQAQETEWSQKRQ
jgi:hypothetical protein